MKILAFDSSAKSASVALIDDNKIIGSYFINTALTHSRTLVPMAHNLLENTNTSIDSVDVFAVSSGPGSFTGVRIGVSAVKGMAMPLNKPCVGVSTLEAMAYNFIQEDCYVISLMDARCNQIYNADFKIKDGRITRLCEDRALAVPQLFEEIKNMHGKVILVGDGAQLFYNSIKELSDNFTLAPEHLRYQNATGVAFASMNKSTVSASELMPTYLRLPQAERELKKRTENKK